MREDTVPERLSVMTILACALGIMLCVVPFFVSVVPPMTDVSQHVLVARVISAYHDADMRFADYFTIDWSLVPGALFYVVFAGMQWLVGAYGDARLYLTGWVVAMFFSVAGLAKVRGHHNPAIPAMTVLPLAFSWYVYMGFLPFLMTFPLFAVAMAFWFCPWVPAVRIPALWIVLVTLFGFHIVGAAAAAAAIMVVAMVESGRNGWGKHLVIEACLAVLPVVLLTGFYIIGANAPKTHIVFANPLGNAINAIRFTCASLNDVSTVLMVSWVVLLVGILVKYRRSLGHHVSILAAATTLIVLAVLIPSDMGALWPAGPRLFPYALILLCVCIPWSRLSRSLVVATCIALLGGLSGFTVWHAYSLDGEFRDFLSGVAGVKAGSRILPVLAEPGEGSRWVVPYWSLASAYTVLKGGSNPYVFAIPYVKTGASPLRYRHPPGERPFAFAYENGKEPEAYRGVSSFYDYVLLWGNASGLERALSEEMIVVHRRGKLVLFATDPGVGYDRPVSP